MRVRDWEFVELVRDFFVAHESLGRILERFHAGFPCFDEFAELVGDEETSILFRLKERSHTLFREDAASAFEMRHEVLFDLAVGSLFHDAMKLRENFYQQEVYAPRLERLLNRANEEAPDFVEEIERIRLIAADRSVEVVEEIEMLLRQCSTQLRHLLVNSPEYGLLLRFLVENPERVEAIFEVGIADLLSDVCGDAVEGYRVAIHSYLESAFFDEAIACMGDLRIRVPSAAAIDLTRLEEYARGMSAYLSGNYAASLDALEAWVDAEPENSEAGYVVFATAALSRIDHLLIGADRDSLLARAESLSSRLKALVEANEAAR